MNEPNETQFIIRHAAVLLIISILVFWLGFVQAPVALWQQIIALLLVIALFSYNKISNIRRKYFGTSLVQWTFIYICLTIVQLMVYSSGGLYSPFFILIHITTLALSFLVNLPIAMLFLIFSIINLLIDTITDAAIHGFIQNSLAGALLYIASVVVVIPMAWFIAKEYRIKEMLTKSLAQQVSLGQTILSNVQEYVFITDKKLNILSTNTPVERNLHLYLADIINRPLLESIVLKTAQGQMATATEFSLDQIMKDKQGRSVPHLRLYVKNQLPMAVQVTIQPIKDENGEVGQLLVIITNQEKNIAQVADTALEQAQLKRQAQIQDLLSQLQQQGQHDMVKQLMFAEGITQDISLVVELQRDGVVVHETLTDIAQVSERLVAALGAKAALLGVGLAFQLPNFQPKIKGKLLLNGEWIGPQTITGPTFTVPIDARWFSVMVHKIVELALYTAAGGGGTVSVDIFEEQASHVINVSAHVQRQGENSTVEDGQPTMVQYSSGLEQYLVEAIAPHMPIGLRFIPDASRGVHTWQIEIFKPQVNSKAP